MTDYSMFNRRVESKRHISRLVCSFRDAQSRITNIKTASAEDVIHIERSNQYHRGRMDAIAQCLAEEYDLEFGSAFNFLVNTAKKL